ncbi:polysaccharide biosynthesis protein [Pseudorhodobacter aquimaris]|uniref:polysaccharide biosynthesis protein n=1 Tax=Pseudorhodobacter aquimaris TaxID=687412 RepID=UPI000A9A6061|nr:nucleoside-diphosphate sugar epimerase/dehydratase [Pseudorhodobacter aquimaris]
MPLIRPPLFKIVDRMSRPQKKAFLSLVDITLAPVAFLISASVLYNSLPDLAFLQANWIALALLAALAGGFSALLKLQNIKLKAYESGGILRTGIMALLVTLSFALIVAFTTLQMPRIGIILFGLVFFLATVGTRFALLHILLWVLREGRIRRRVVIYGAGPTGMQLLAALRSHDSILPVAFVDDNPGLHGMSAGGLKIYGSDRILDLSTRLEADRVLLAMPSLAPPKLEQIARKLQVMGLTVMTVPSFAQLVGVERLVDTLAPVSPVTFLGREQLDSDMFWGGGSYHDRVVLVTGAGGSVGSALCRQLLTAKPACIILFEVSEIALYTIERQLIELSIGTNTRIVAVLGSVTDSRMARMVMADHRVDIVLHAAAYKHVPLVEANPIAGLANNVLGTRTLADAAHETGVKKFVLISTDKAVRPTNVMGASKRLAELVVQDLAKRAKGTDFSIVRFGNVLGSSGSVIPLFKEQIAKGGPITLTHEDVTRYFMTLTEAARLVLLAGSYAEAHFGGNVFVLDMGEPVKIRDLARQMIEAAGFSVRDADAPDGDIEIAITGLRPGEKLFEELLIGEGLLTTPHPKILRAQEDSLTELQMAKALRSLRAAIATGSTPAALDVICTYVKEYAPPQKLTIAQ